MELSLAHFLDCKNMTLELFNDKKLGYNHHLIVVKL